ncbi:putative S-adenosyl-L-methionine-dependent methyltransferase [Dioscorea sansibarensis]
MGAHGKGSRGKRSSASYVSTVSMVVFIAFCVLGIWMLTSSSIVPTSHSQPTTARLSTSRSFLKDHPPPFEDLSAEDGAKGGVGAIEQVSEEEDDDMKAQQHQEQQRVEEEKQPQKREEQEVEIQKQEGKENPNLDGGVDEESRKQIDPEDQGSQQQQQQEEEQTGDESGKQEQSQQQQREDEQVGDGSENQEQPQQQQEEGDGNRDDGSQAQSEQQEGNNEEQQQQEQQEQQADSGENDTSSQQQVEENSSNGPNDETRQRNEGDEKQLSDPNVGESLRDGDRLEVSNESDGNKRPWATQADQSDNEKERRKEEEGDEQGKSQSNEGSEDVQNLLGYEWELCNVTVGPDYIPCLDNTKAIKKLHSLRHYEHRERHCPEEPPTCLVPLPKGYRMPIVWPKSRDKIWYNNVPHTKLVEVKGHQNWVKVAGEYLMFPGGGTQFIHGALHYVDFIQQSVHDIAWGKRTRVILDVGCGVASFGGYLFERNVLAMSFAPKDEHEAQVQFALERGIPAISAVMGTQRLQFPSRVFDLVHCARCRVPWHADGGTLLLELNRVLRPGGYFVWSATPVYQKLKEDVEIWKAMTSLTISMCWDLVTIKKDKLNGVAAAIYRKPVSNECYENRKHHNPPMCNEDDDPNAAWYIPMKACMHRVPVDASERGSKWPEQWPRRVASGPYWLNNSQVGVYGKPAPDDFRSDYEHWKRVVTKSYLNGLGVDWSKVRNVMDMRAVYGGFAAALKDLNVWVMNVVNIDAPDTLPIIYERGLLGIYHDWCESFSTYPRTYDLLHADHLFSQLKERCNIVPVMAEIDRIVRPGGKLIVRDETGIVSQIENVLKSLHWEIRLTFSKDQEGILCAEKTEWRPEKYAASS